MIEPMRYMSEEWIRARWELFEKCFSDYSDCGGWGPDTLCGDCSRCLRMQFQYALEQEEKKVRTYLAAGFKVYDLNAIQVPSYGSHESFNCCAHRERIDWRFPWEKLT